MKRPKDDGTKQPCVAVIDDDISSRVAISRLLRSARFDVAEYASAEDYLSHFDPDMPGCIVLDLMMPGLDGLGLQSELAKRQAPPIIFLSGAAHVPDSVTAFKHGALDFFTKPVDDAALLDAVHNALDLDRNSREIRAAKEHLTLLFHTLTPREKEVFHLVVRGNLNKKIAEELGTTEKTIKKHRARVMGKMQADSLAELVVFSVELDNTRLRL